MFHHLTLGTNDLAAGGAFYDSVLDPLGLVRTWNDEEGDGWLCWQFLGQKPLGGTDPGFWLCHPADGAAATAANGGTIAFDAPTRSAVREFHDAALKAGGTCEGPPGLRPHYGENYYGAYVRDPVGNKIAAVCRAALAWWDDLPACFFGSPPNRTQLARLIAIGRKRATAGAFTGAPVSAPGMRWIAVDERARPVCVFETKRVDIVPISAIDADFAATEGEGDGSLAYWMAVHEAFFRWEGTWAPDMLVEAERFELVEAIDPSAVADPEAVLAVEAASAAEVLGRL
jgi:uncharacterized protein YhfF/catechol 2,3-dioxygenase-like lactoylglutathione lyase family enzyme